jgi:hypothetical protein
MTLTLRMGTTRVTPIGSRVVTMTTSETNQSINQFRYLSLDTCSTIISVSPLSLACDIFLPGILLQRVSVFEGWGIWWARVSKNVPGGAEAEPAG